MSGLIAISVLVAMFLFEEVFALGIVFVIAVLVRLAIRDAKREVKRTLEQRRREDDRQ